MDKLNNDISILENYIVPRLLLYLLAFPDGVQRVDYRKDLEISSTSAMNAHKICFNVGLIENKKSLDKLLFGLTEKGKKVAEKLKEIDFIIKNEN
jgi:hypothetical protein